MMSHACTLSDSAETRGTVSGWSKPNATPGVSEPWAGGQLRTALFALSCVFQRMTGSDRGSMMSLATVSEMPGSVSLTASATARTIQCTESITPGIMPFIPRNSVGEFCHELAPSLCF